MNRELKFFRKSKENIYIHLLLPFFLLNCAFSIGEKIISITRKYDNFIIIFLDSINNNTPEGIFLKLCANTSK